MLGIPREVIEHKLGIDPSFNRSSKKKEDIHQKGTRLLGKRRKSIDHLKLGSSVQ
jgi:hypothetical protein